MDATADGAESLDSTAGSLTRMITIDIRVDHAPAIMIVAHEDEGGIVLSFEYQIVCFPETGACVTQHGRLTHVRTDGIQGLAQKLCALAGQMS